MALAAVFSVCAVTVSRTEDLRKAWPMSYYTRRPRPKLCLSKVSSGCYGIMVPPNVLQPALKRAPVSNGSSACQLAAARATWARSKLRSAEIPRTAVMPTMAQAAIVCCGWFVGHCSSADLMVLY